VLDGLLVRRQRLLGLRLLLLVFLRSVLLARALARRLTLRRLGRAEELCERALTHARAPSRH
jgi:hypothetical protein